MSSKEIILERARSVAALPIQTLEIIDLVQNPDVAMSQLQELIERDPGMTSNVLRMANSPSFRGVYEIGSIREALVRLGTKTVLELAVASAVAPVARQPVAGYDMPAGELLTHSVVTATTANELAKHLKIDVNPRVFTAALLHDIGKTVLGTFIQVNPQPIIDLAFVEHIPFDEAELRVLGTNHPEVGAVLLESWGLPKTIVNAVAFHHRPDFCPDSDRSAAEFVHVADILGRLCGLGVGVDGLNYTASPEAVHHFQITTHVAEEVTAKMIDTVSDMLDVFDVQAGSESHGN